MNIIRKAILVGALFTTAFTGLVMAYDTNFDRAINAITNTLPPGWAIAEIKPDEIPWGHHWNENYTGPTGLLLVVRGTRPVNAEFLDTNGTWDVIHNVATESLHIWLMPSNYSDSFWSKFDLTRPVTPAFVVAKGPVKVYATPTNLVDSQKRFDEILKKYYGVCWPDSPANNPKLLSWKDWRQKLREAIEKEFQK